MLARSPPSLVHQIVLLDDASLPSLAPTPASLAAVLGPASSVVQVTVLPTALLLLQVVTLPQRVGYLVARNMGAALCKAPALVFLSSAIEVPSYCFRETTQPLVK